MKLEINVDMNDRNLEYTQGPIDGLTGYLSKYYYYIICNNRRRTIRYYKNLISKQY